MNLWFFFDKRVDLLTKTLYITDLMLMTLAAVPVQRHDSRELISPPFGAVFFAAKVLD